MFQRLAARPLALTAALFLFCGCDDGGNGTPSTNIDGTTSGSGSGSTSEAGSTSPEGSTTDDEGTTSGDAESSTGSEGSSSGGETTGSTGGSALGYVDLAGDYVEFFPGGMTLHTLSADGWVLDYGTGPITQTVVTLDDTARWVVLEDDTMGTYLRNDWTFDGEGVLRYCTAAFDAPTPEAATEAPPSDPRDLDGTGCGGMFPWSALEPAE